MIDMISRRRKKTGSKEKSGDEGIAKNKVRAYLYLLQVCILVDIFISP